MMEAVLLALLHDKERQSAEPPLSSPEREEQGFKARKPGC